MFTPTKEDLEELWMTRWRHHASVRLFNWNDDIDIEYYTIDNSWEIFISSKRASFTFHPKSKKDIKLLLKMFTISK